MFSTHDITSLGFYFYTRTIYNCRVAALHFCETELSCNCSGPASSWKRTGWKEKNRGGTIHMNNAGWKITGWVLKSLESSAECRLRDSTRLHAHFSHDILHQSSANLHQIWSRGIYTMPLTQKWRYFHLKTKLYCCVKLKKRRVESRKIVLKWCLGAAAGLHMKTEMIPSAG